jgi:hypothetical protein
MSPPPDGVCHLSHDPHLQRRNCNVRTHLRTGNCFTALCRWGSNGTADWDPPIYGDSVGEDFGVYPRLTFPISQVNNFSHVTRVNISSPEMVGGITPLRFFHNARAQLDDFRGWRNGTLEYTGWVLVMSSPESSILTDYATDTGDPSCYAVRAARHLRSLSPLHGPHSRFSSMVSWAQLSRSSS